MVTGTHILLNATSNNNELLVASEKFKQFILNCISEFDLVQVGTVFHQFSGGGFTAVVCLTESHLAIHTWPELNYYTADIYLCDYTRNNFDLANSLNEKIKLYFNSTNIKEQIIKR